MKENVLTCIYNAFDNWLTQWDFVCKKGCSACCTQHVTMTSLEGALIYRYVHNNKKENWLYSLLQSVEGIDQPGPTTNEFADRCLKDEVVEPPLRSHEDPCPLLYDQCCTIYEVRPFNCRCFASFEKCGPNHAAVVPDFILTGATTVLQIIEHLDQRGQWGNMFDILRIHSNRYSQKCRILQRIHECKPLPGFLIPPEDFDQVQPLLESIFSSEVNGKRLETILNGG